MSGLPGDHSFISRPVPGGCQVLAQNKIYETSSMCNYEKIISIFIHTHTYICSLGTLQRMSK